MQLQAQRDMAEKMIDVCFQRCVSAPEERLSDKQRRCLDACAGAFIEGYQIAVSARPRLGRGGDCGVPLLPYSCVWSSYRARAASGEFTVRLPRSSCRLSLTNARSAPCTAGALVRVCVMRSAALCWRRGS